MGLTCGPVTAFTWARVLATGGTLRGTSRRSQLIGALLAHAHTEEGIRASQIVAATGIDLTKNATDVLLRGTLSSRRRRVRHVDFEGKSLKKKT